MVKGLAELNRRWGKIPREVREETMKAMERQAKKIVRDMKRLAPKNSGALAASIGWTWGDAPRGAMTIGTVGGGKSKRAYGSLRITIFAGGTAATKRNQLRGGKRTGSFDTDNAVFQEFGTSRMQANPFFFPAWRARRKLAKSGIRRGMNRGIKRG